MSAALAITTITSISKLNRVLDTLVAAAEEMFGDGTGPEKKAWVIEQLNERIDIPFINEDQEGRLLSFLLDVVVDRVLGRAIGQLLAS